MAILSSEEAEGEMAPRVSQREQSTTAVRFVRDEGAQEGYYGITGRAQAEGDCFDPNMNAMRKCGCLMPWVVILFLEEKRIGRSDYSSGKCQQKI